MSEYKIWVNYILFRVGIRKILPSKFISRIEINENGEELVRMDEDDSLYFRDTLKKPVYIRKTVYEMIKNAQKLLNEKELTFKIYDGYRSIEIQKSSWEERLKQTRDANPGVSEEEVKRLTSLKVANPHSKKASGHQTGGAVDLTLCDKSGKELPMGTGYAEYNDKTKSFAKGITKEEEENRELLLDVMKKSGFVNFPAEWWHYCYGDSMWAAYKNKKECFYGHKEP